MDILTQGALNSQDWGSKEIHTS